VKSSFALLLLALSLGVLAPTLAQADATADLTAGRAALAQGDLDKALPLLQNAAEALPQSVEAQLSLAEAQLRLGRLEAALVSLRSVLRLSPGHRQAQTLVDALTSGSTGLASRLATARALAEVRAFAEAESILAKSLDLPGEPAQRFAARLLLAEVRLWLSQPGPALPEAVRVGQEAAEPAQTGPARVIAALALLSISGPEKEQARKFLAEAGELVEPWKSRAIVARLLLDLDSSADPAQLSAALRTSWNQIPSGPFRQRWQKNLLEYLIPLARQRAEQADAPGTLAILWPMLSDQPPPSAAQVMKSLPISGGWLDNDPQTREWQAVAHLFAALGAAELQRSGSSSTNLGYWLAFETLRQMPRAQNDAEALLLLAHQLSGLLDATGDPRPGQTPSRLDEIRLKIVSASVAGLKNEAERARLVGAILWQLRRDAAADTLAAGLDRYVSLVSGEAPRLAPGPASFQLLLTLATHYAELGAKDFARATASLDPQANVQLQPHDATALRLAGQGVRLAPRPDSGFSSKKFLELGQAIIERYAGHWKWAAASAGLALLQQSGTSSDNVWALLKMQARQVQAEEALKVQARLQLGAELAPKLKELLSAASQLVVKENTPQNRQAAKELAENLSRHYGQLSRPDLAAEVLQALAGAPADHPLSDWLLWSQIDLETRAAQVRLAVASQKLAKGGPLALDPGHAAVLAKLGKILKDHPNSEYVSQVINKLTEISQFYAAHRSHTVARSVLSDFHKSFPQLSGAEQLEYRIVEVTLAQARLAFAERSDLKAVPKEISPEFQAALASLAAHLQAHAAGETSAAASREFVNLARMYGEVGAWPLSRQVLQQFAKALPNWKDQHQLRLWDAATYLGELDRSYGLSLLQFEAMPRAGDENTALGYLAFDRPLSTGPAYGAPLNAQTGAGGYGGGMPKDTASKLALPMAGPVFDDRNQPGQERSESDLALAQIRAAEQRQLQQLAMLRDREIKDLDGIQKQGKGEGKSEAFAEISLPSGVVLSDDEMKRQDAAADQAYTLLLALAKLTSPEDLPVAMRARAQLLWLFGFFEGQLRADRAIVLIRRFLTDLPSDPARTALALRAISDQLHWAGQRQPADRINVQWVDARHALYDQARTELRKFIAEQLDLPDYAHQARLLLVQSFQQEAALAQLVSAVRAGGLLVQSAQALLDLAETAPDHPQAAEFPTRIWNLAEQIHNLGLQEQSIYVLSRIPLRFPLHDLAHQAILRIAQHYAQNLSNPLRAVETYQEYLHLNGDTQVVSSQIFEIGQQLAAKQRYLEALHVYGVFVDSFPTEPRAPLALQAIGQTHQSNEAWTEAIQTYQRILREYPGHECSPHVSLAIAECHINLSEWTSARRSYEDYLQKYPSDGQAQVAKTRMEVLKMLDRFQTLLADQQIQRNKDDAQFQIGRIVLEQLSNPLKAAAEFRKVVSVYPQSPLADDAQLEVGKALLTLKRLDEARIALLLVVQKYPTSPVADDALYLVAQSYEKQAEQLASVTVETARQEAFLRNQRGAYQVFNQALTKQLEQQAQRRDELRKTEGGKSKLGLEEASQAWRYNGSNLDNLGNTARAAELNAEQESALQLASRQDRINDAYREAVALYARAAAEFPLGDVTDESLLRVAQIQDIHLKDRKSAVTTYQKIVKFFPGTPVAEDAAWKVAQFLEQEAQYELAVNSYRDFIRNYPASPRLPDAQFALAEALEQLGRWNEAMDAYEIFRQRFGQHPRAQLALEQLNWIRTYRK